MTRPAIAVLGTGVMGYHMAARLCGARYQVTVWNRSPGKAQRLAAHGAQVAGSAAGAVAGAGITIMMLSDGPASDSVLHDGGAMAAMKTGGTIVNMASIPVETARDQAGKAGAAGLRYLDAPVSGGEAGAHDGTLAVMVGGKQADFDVVKPVLEVMGRPMLVGPAGCGQLAKLCNQLIVANTITTVAEALLLAKQGGADPAAVREALLGGFADSTILKQHGRRMLEGDYKPGGASSLQLKDCRTIVALAQDLGLDLPVITGVTRLYEQFVESQDGGKLDHAAIYLELARLNDIEL